MWLENGPWCGALAMAWPHARALATRHGVFAILWRVFGFSASPLFMFVAKCVVSALTAVSAAFVACRPYVSLPSMAGGSKRSRYVGRQEPPWNHHVAQASRSCHLVSPRKPPCTTMPQTLIFCLQVDAPSQILKAESPQRGRKGFEILLAELARHATCMPCPSHS